jgi:hypothetical protein
MSRSIRLWPLLFLLSVTQVFADARMSVLVDVLRLPEAAQILSNEGLGYAQTLNDEMLNGQGGAGWQVQVGAIYDATRMVEIVRAALEAELEGTALEQAIAFYGSDLGDKIVSLENSARTAIQNPDIEEAARARYSTLNGRDDPRFAQVSRYIASGDMLNQNVTSALNSNVQFLRGLVDGGAMKMSEDEILSDVSNGLEATREDTTSWLYGFRLLAYHPLTDAELEAYIAFSQTSAGQALNRALFNGFGTAYEDISYALGRAVALNMTAQEL